MFKFTKSIGEIPQASGVWEKIRRENGAYRPYPAALATPLEETALLEANPGNLRMFTYVPSLLGPDPALVVVLHGCTQTAAGYDRGAGWSTLANRYGFALLFPEQQRSNNPNSCFNWFEPGDTRRGRGEAASIRHMIEKMVREKGIDPRRVFITGLSAGGAMTSAMLACYPEVFVGGAIIAGLPYGAAHNVQQAFENMFQCPSRTAREWGELVRAAAPRHQGPWPRISVWHGSADKTVIPSNAREILKQWTEVHRLTSSPTFQNMVDGYPRQIWVNEAGEEVIESYTITHMAHGTPLATGKSDNACGAVGPFLLETGISSSYHIARFFGLTAAGVRQVHKREVTMPRERRSFVESAAIDEIEVSTREITNRTPNSRTPSSPRVNIGAVIATALEAAGLMKRG